MCFKIEVEIYLKFENVERKMVINVTQWFMCCSLLTSWHCKYCKNKALTFNKYSCTQCYIHVLYIGTQK